VTDTDEVAQPLVALAVPSVALILASAGLHPRSNSCVPIIAWPPTVKIGFVRIAIHLTVRDIVVVLLHASLAVNVLVIERLQSLLTTGPSEEVIVGLPHASVAVALPSEPGAFSVLQVRIISV